MPAGKTWRSQSCLIQINDGVQDTVANTYSEETP
jgi:hypothetical protein